MKRVSIIAVMMILLSSSVLWAQGESVSSPEMKKSSFGLGFGIPYGTLGLNLDINIVHNLNLSAGVGTTIFAGIGYNFGLKYFFTSIKQTFRPRVSSYYGVNAMTAKKSPTTGEIEDGKSYIGFSPGVGAQWMWGKTKSNGLDLDIIYLATTGGYNDAVEKLREEGFTVTETGKVKIAIGYRWAFNINEGFGED